jgi:hypothetical protein
MYVITRPFYLKTPRLTKHGAEVTSYCLVITSNNVSNIRREGKLSIDYKGRTAEKQKDAQNKLIFSWIYRGGKFFHKLKDQVIMSRPFFPFSLHYITTSLHYSHYTILTNYYYIIFLLLLLLLLITYTNI